MGFDTSYPAICAQVNSAFRVPQLIVYLNWHPDKMVKSGDIYLAYCPIHKDEVFRTLALNPRNNTYQCLHVNCPGNNAADFLDLVQKLTMKPLPDVILDMAEHFTNDYFRLSSRQIEVLKKLSTGAKTPAEEASGSDR